MSNPLNAISLAIGLLASNGHVDSGAWKGYVWSVASTEPCLSGQFCDLVGMRWDWKRDQKIKIAARINKSGLDIRLQLINNDPKDDDDVCVTALMRDAKKRVVAVFHSNSHSYPKTNETVVGSVSLSKGVLGSITSVAVGSKQCRKGPHEDDAVYSAAKARTSQK